MDHAKVSRLAGAVLVALAVYVIGVFLAIHELSAMEDGKGRNEWSDSTLRAFWAFVASFPLAALTISAALARLLAAPVLATVAGTASGIAILWFALWVIAR